MQKICLFQLFIPLSDWPHPFLTLSTPIIFNYLLIWGNLYQDVKNQLMSSVLTWDIVSFRIQICHTNILIMSNQKVVNQPLTFVIFYLHVKKWGCFINLFWRNSWFKNRAIWLAESSSAYISETRFFPNAVLAGTQQII